MKQLLSKMLSLKAFLLVCLLIGMASGAWAQKITDYNDIVSGKKYYIGATTGGNDYYLYVDGRTSTQSTAGTAKTSKEEASVFTFEGSGASWSIKFESTFYLSLKSSKDNGKVMVVSAKDDAMFTASNQSGKLRLTRGSYSIQKNNTGTQFGSYGNTQTDVWLEEVAEAESSPLASIAVNASEAKTVFYIGDSFTHDGVVVTATYEDESTKDVTADAIFSTPDMTSADTKTVTVTYTENEVEKTTSYDIEVKAPATLESITLSGTYPMEFTQGGVFSSEGIVVTANYDDESTKDVTGEATFSGYDMSATGTQTVTVSFGGKTATYTINVNEYVAPSQLVIDFENDLATYSEWTFENIGTSNTTITAHGGSKYGANINTGGNGVGTCTIATTNKINPAAITFYISKVSTNTSASSWYVEVSENGTSWAEVGVADAKSMSKGEWKEISYGLKEYSDVYVRIRYDGSTAIRAIDDITLELASTTPKVLSSIALSGEYPTTFHVGDAFSHANMIVTATYEGDTTADVTDEATFTGYDMSIAGTQEVTVSYTEGEVTKTAIYSIIVNAPATLSSIVLSGTYKTKFTQGDEFSSEGIVVTANYDDETTKIVTTEASFSGYDMETVGEQTVVVTYADKTSTYTITVAEKKGIASNPYTVAEARAAIDAGTGVSGVYATGIVSEIVSAYNSQYGNITYNISTDGSTDSDQLQAYRGKSYNGANFTSEDDIQVGDVVVIYGNLKKYSSTYEFDQNNQLVRLTRKPSAGLAFENESYTTVLGENFTAPVLTTAEGFDGTISYDSSNKTVATIANDGTVTVLAAGMTTITATSIETAKFKEGNASYTLNVEKKTPTLAFGEEAYEVLIDGTITITATSNSEGTITYASSDDNVATIDEESGEVLAGDAVGFVTITATLSETDEFKGATAGVTLTVKDSRKAVTTITAIAPTTIYMGQSGNFTLTETIAEGATPTYVYTSDDDDILLVDNGEFVAVAPGTVNVTVDATDETEVCAPTQFKAEVTVSYRYAAPAIEDEEFSGSKILTFVAVDGAEIYYTIDGSEPTNASAKYTSAIELTATTTIKAIVIDEDGCYSPVATATYSKVAVKYEAITLVQGQTLSFTDFYGLGSYDNNRTDYLLASDGDTYKWTGSQYCYSTNGTQSLQMRANGNDNGTGTIISSPVSTENGFTLTLTYTDNATPTVKVNDETLEAVSSTSTSSVYEISATEAVVTIVAGSKATYIKSITFEIPNPAPTIETTDIALDFYDDNLQVDILEYINSNSTGSFTYTSNDPTIVTIDEYGIVTGLKEGTTSITVSQAADDNYRAGEATINVTIVDTRVVATTIPAINITTLTEGDADGTISVVNAEKADENVTFSFTSSDEDVLLIDGTDYTVGKIGTTTITVTATPSDDKLYLPATAQFEVTVNAFEMIDTEIQMATAGSTTYGTPLFVDYELTDGYNGEMTYVIANNAIADVEITEGVITITPKAVGTTTITFSAEGTTTYNAAEDVIYTLEVEQPEGKTEAPIAAVTLFRETFNSTEGSGGRDDIFTGSVGTGAVTSDEDWETISSNGAYQCIKLGTSKAAGSVTTSEIALTGNGTLTFAAAGWGDTNTNTIKVTADGATLSGDVNVTLTNGAWSTYTVNITEATGSVSLTFTMKRGFLDDVKVESDGATITAKLNSFGYASFCSEYPLSFSDDADVKAWVVTEVNGNEITFEKVLGTIKGGTGLLLKGQPDAIVSLTSEDSENVLDDNMLIGTLAPTYVESGNYYGLSGETFKKVNTGVVKAGKAILPLTWSADVQAFTFIFKDVETGVETIETVSASEVAQIFDLNGRRLAKTQKGFNIVNGKKVIVK